jgi:hypothetical protein
MELLACSSTPEGDSGNAALLPRPSWSGVVGGDTPVADVAAAPEGREEVRLEAPRAPVADDSMWGTDAAPLKNCA